MTFSFSLKKNKANKSLKQRWPYLANIRGSAGEEPLPVGNDLEMGIGGGGGAPTASSGDWKIPPPTGNPLKGRFEEAEAV